MSLPGLLLAGVVALAAVLTYQAQDAARSQRATAESALRDYSAFAASEFSRELRLHAQTLLRLSFSRLLTRVGRDPSLRHADAELVARDVDWQRTHRIEPNWCACLDSVRYYFALDVATATLNVAVSPEGGQVPELPSADVRQWMRDTLLQTVAATGTGGAPTVTTFGSNDGLSRRFDLAITNDSYGFLIGESDGGDRLLAYVIARDPDGVPLAVYGYEADPKGWLHPLLQLTVEEEHLLPPSLLRDRPNSSVLSVVVSDQLGHELFRSAPIIAETFVARQTLTSRFGGLEVQLGLYSQMAEQLVVGGLPSSRLPLLVALFLLTAGLAVVALLQMRHQQELARMRGDFVAGVSHELRTPLAQIRWFAELLRMGRLRTAEERERSLRVIDQEARRLTFLVENVLNFSRTGSRAARLRPERVELAAEVREIVDGFTPLVASRNVTVSTDLDDEVEAMVDRAALRQIVLNLLDNAAKYGPAGQTIVVGVGRGDPRHVLLWVEDEGPGVPEGERENVWGAFYRAGRDRGSAVTGSGIGLAVVGDLVTLQHGRRRIESAPGGGARVVLEFPAPPSAPRSQSRRQDDIPDEELSSLDAVPPAGA